MSREDPKPGRWILPLVVAGLIGFTYVFVNALPAAEVSTPDTSSAASSTTSTTEGPTTSSSTTLSPDATALVENTRTIGRNVDDLVTLAQQINDDWDTRAKEFGPTRDALQGLEADTETLANDVAAIEPPGAIDEWAAVVAGFEALKTAAADMIDGLVNAAGSEPRLKALEDYEIAAATITNALADVREAVRDPAA